MPPNALPILFYNMGGEMLYVLDQRLKAQSIPAERGRKVFSDIVGTMYKPQFLQEMMKASSMYSKQAIRTIFNKLVHSSIMRVNKESMDKLYDLMVMAVKYQISQCINPSDLLHITLNHLDSTLEFVKELPNVKAKVLEAYDAIIDMYGNMKIGDFALIRQYLLSFLQDTNNKVSIYLAEKIQNEDGRFIIRTTDELPEMFEPPGVMKLYKQGDEVTVHFESEGHYKPYNSSLNVSLELNGARATTLGTNIYTNAKNYDYNSHTNNSSSPENSKMAKAELGLLAHFIGSDINQGIDKEFKINLFCHTTDNTTETDGDTSSSVAKPAVVEQEPTVFNITATKSRNDSLTKIMNDFSLQSSTSAPTSTSKGDDLLSLLDS